MSIATRIGSMYNNVGYVYDTFELTGTTIDFNKNIENIPKGIRKSYLDIMNNGIEMVWDNWEKVEGTGTAYTLNQTAYAKMKMEYWGNTEQETAVISKNLFDKNNATTQLAQYTSGQDAYFVTTSTTTKMLLIPVNKTGKCAYTVSKIASAKFEVALFNISPGEVITYITESNPGGMPHTRVVDNSATKLTASYLGSDNTKAIGVIYYDSANDTLTEQEIMDSIQIESGTQATDYRPFGPYPTPDFPTEIHTVSGDNTVNVQKKNILNINSDLITTRTGLGVTKTRNDNQTITLTGTANATGTSYFIGTDKNILLLTAGTYTLSSNYSEEVRLQLSNSANVTGTFTLLEDAYIINGTFHFTNGKEYNETIWLQLEKNDEATSYEPYQNTSYPINLPVENIFDKDTATYTGTGWATLDNFIEVQPNTTYTLQGKLVPISWVATFSFYDKNQEVLSTQGITNSNNKYTITTPENTKYLKFNMRTNTVDFNTIQLELGSKANQYTPYGTTPIELCKIGNYQDRIFKSTGKNLLRNLTAYYVVGGTSGGVAYNAIGNSFTPITSPYTTDANYRGAGFIGQVKKGITYTFSCDGFVSGLSMSCAIYETFEKMNNNTNQLERFVLTSTNGTFTPNYDGYALLSVMASTSGTTLTWNYAQLEKGEQATSYEPYGEPKWYLYKATGKAVLDGSENGWAIEGSQAPYSLSINNLYRNNAYSTVMSNYYVGSYWNENWNNYSYLVSCNTSTTTTPTIKFKNVDISSLEDFKTWLSTHNTTVYYVLETPTYTEITDTTLLSQLEVIKKSYEGQTNISQDNNDLPFDLWSIALWED